MVLHTLRLMIRRISIFGSNDDQVIGRFFQNFIIRGKNLDLLSHEVLCICYCLKYWRNKAKLLDIIRCDFRFGGCSGKEIKKYLPLSTLFHRQVIKTAIF